MRRWIMCALLAATPVLAQDQECFPVQDSHALCQNGSPFQPGNLVALGEQNDGWDYFQAQDLFVRILQTPSLGTAANQMRKAYFQTVQGTIDDASHTSVSADGRVNFALSVRQNGALYGSPVYVTLIPLGADVLIVETVFPNRFQAASRAELTHERGSKHADIVAKIKVVS